MRSSPRHAKEHPLHWGPTQIAELPTAVALREDTTFGILNFEDRINPPVAVILLSNTPQYSVSHLKGDSTKLFSQAWACRSACRFPGNYQL